MNLIDELLENDTTTLEENKSPSKQTFKPQVNNGRFSEIEDIESEDFTEINEPQIEDHFEEPQPTNNGATAEMIDENFDNEIETNELSEAEKKRNFLFAEMRVQMFSIAGSMACQFLSGEWGEEHENKYTPSKSKQKELAKCIAEVMNIEMKVKDPRNTMYEMFAVVFAPLLFSAAQKGFRNKKKKKAEKLKVVKSYNPQPQTQPQPQPQPKTENYNFEPEIIKPEKEPEPEPQSKFSFIDEKQTAEVETILSPSKDTLNNNGKVIGNFAKKETRGRKKGSKRNPKTRKMEQPYKIENGLMYYSWGETKKVKK